MLRLNVKQSIKPTWLIGPRGIAACYLGHRNNFLID